MTATGILDEATRARVKGWAIDPAEPEAPVSLLLTVNEVLVSRLLADRDRPDLRDAGIGGGRHGFSFDLKGLSPLERHVIAVRREADASHLEGSPALLEPALQFDAAFQTQCAALLADAADTAELRQRLSFLSTEAEKLLCRHADQLSQRDERLAHRQIKWRWQTGERQAGNTQPLPPRALVIDEMVPDSKRDAGSNAILSHMRALRRLGFEVSFAASVMTPDPTGQLAPNGIACLHAPWHGSVEEVLRREAEAFDLVYLHRITIADRYLAMARFHQPKARIVFSVADLHHLRLARQAQADDRPELLALARRLQATELRAASIADTVLTHSTVEAALLRQQLPAAQVHVVPWAVAARPTQVPFSKRNGLAFIAHFPHPPNLRAASWLVADIMPAVRALWPTMPCLLVGSDMPETLKNLGSGIEGVGEVDDLAEIFDRVRLTVAPLIYGAGIKGKVLASLAAGVPCICTPIAAEGLDLPPLLRKLIADDPGALAANIVRLHQDETLNQETSLAGLAFIRQAMSDARIDALMREVAAVPASWPALAETELNLGSS